MGGPGHQGRDGGLNLRTSVTLLLTPAVNDMGAGKTVEDWDAWTDRMKTAHGNGNGHGASLAIEAQRLLPTPMTDPNSHNGHARDLGSEARLMPTPRASDGEKGGPNQRGSSGDLMLPAAVQPGRWGAYEAAVARWEVITGRQAPPATEQDWERWQRARQRRFTSRKPIGHRGSLSPFVVGPAPRLSARFVEWLMGLPAGWVTEVPGVERNAQLKALGNGVVPQQAALAVGAMLADVPAHVLDRLRAPAAGACEETDDQRCPSCEHTAWWHDVSGCGMAVVQGRPGAALNCPCGLVASEIPKWRYSPRTDGLVSTGQN